MLIDKSARKIDYLRISVTDKCNFRCVYCMPQEGIALKTHEEMLTFEEIRRVAAVMASLGISKIKLTGGEPLVRRGVINLVRRLAEIEGMDDLSLTTNGALLSWYADDLRRAGLRRINISLDTLKEDRFSAITRFGSLNDVLAGIERALGAGFEPVKINVVVIRGTNDDEIEDFARLTLARPLHIRFIEFMPMKKGLLWNRERFVSICEIKSRLGGLIGVGKTDAPRGAGPAEYYKLPHAEGTIGFIGALSKPFCENCNRLRLSADGKLRLCLHHDIEIDLKAPLRAGATDSELKRVIEDALAIKPHGHCLSISGAASGTRSMAQIGG